MTQGIATQCGIAARFESLLGSGSVMSDPVVLERYVVDGVLPSAVIIPTTEQQVAAALKIASEEGWAVSPFGGGTHQHVGRPPEHVNVVLSTERLNAIEAYDPGDLTVALQAGITVAKAASACLENRQLLPIESRDGGTIGGAMATASTGPWQCAFGGIRDFCIGVNFVTGDGLPAKGGGRVVKNVAGYDLMKLLIGSHGTLGVITSANFKLFPQPQQTLSFVCEFDSAADLFRFRDTLLLSPVSPISAEMLSPSATEYLDDAEPRDPDVWAPHTQKLEKSGWMMALRFSASERVAQRLRRELASCTSRELHGRDEPDFWNRLLQLEERLLSRNRNAMLFRVNVPISESQALTDAAEDSATNYNFVSVVFGRASLGSFVVGFVPLAIDPPAVTQFASAASDFRSRLSRSASAVVTHVPAEAKQHFDVWGSTPTDVELMRKIKQALDPKGILNRGRFIFE